MKHSRKSKPIALQGVIYRLTGLNHGLIYLPQESTAKSTSSPGLFPQKMGGAGKAFIR